MISHARVHAGARKGASVRAPHPAGNAIDANHFRQRSETPKRSHISGQRADTLAALLGNVIDVMP